MSEKSTRRRRKKVRRAERGCGQPSVSGRLGRSWPVAVRLSRSMAAASRCAALSLSCRQ
jgi:hypothetical protein